MALPFPVIVVESRSHLDPPVRFRADGWCTQVRPWHGLLPARERKRNGPPRGTALEWCGWLRALAGGGGTIGGHGVDGDSGGLGHVLIPPFEPRAPGCLPRRVW